MNVGWIFFWSYFQFCVTYFFRQFYKSLRISISKLQLTKRRKSFANGECNILYFATCFNKKKYWLWHIFVITGVKHTFLYLCFIFLSLVHTLGPSPSCSHSRSFSIFYHLFHLTPSYFILLHLSHSFTHTLIPLIAYWGL